MTPVKPIFCVHSIFFSALILDEETSRRALPTFYLESYLSPLRREDGRVYASLPSELMPAATYEITFSFYPFCHTAPVSYFIFTIPAPSWTWTWMASIFLWRPLLIFSQWRVLPSHGGHEHIMWIWSIGFKRLYRVIVFFVYFWLLLV